MTPNPIRLIIQQPALAAYRVPVFRELARRPGIQLKLLYGDSRDGPPNVPPDGFTGEMIPQRRLHLGKRTLIWHSPQWTASARGACDVLMLYWDLHYLSLHFALRRARHHGIKTILWGHGVSKNDAPWRARARLRMAKRADAVLFYNQTIAGEYIAKGLDAQRAFVAPNSLDQTPIRQARDSWLSRPADLSAFQAQHQLNPAHTILFIARLDPGRRLDLLFQALAQLRHRIPDAKLLVIGQGPGPGAAQIALQTLARDLNIAEQVIFAGALYDQMQIAPWMLSSRVACFPSELGLSLLHVFGYGLPAVASDRSSAHGPEIAALQNGENGLLFADGQVTALAQALEKILTNDALAARMSHQALATITETYTLENMVDGMEAAVKFCAGR